MKRHVLRIGRRIGIAIAGGAVIIVGIVLALPLVPGPGIPLILLGLGILSLEFQWPRVWLAHIKDKGLQLKDVILRWPRVWLAHVRKKVARLKELFSRKPPPPSGDNP